MVRLKLAEAAQQRLSLIDALLPTSVAYTEPVDHSELLSVSEWARSAKGSKALQEKGLTDFRLAALLKDADLHVDVAPPRTRSPELTHRLSSLRANQEADQYAQMTSSRRAGPTPFQIATERPLSPALARAEMQEARKHLSAILNVLASMGALFTAGWWVSGSYSIGIRVLIALFAALFIGAAEGWLYYRHFSRAGQPRRQGRRPSRIAIRAHKNHRDHLRQKAISQRSKRQPERVVLQTETKKNR